MLMKKLVIFQFCGTIRMLVHYGDVTKVGDKARGLGLGIRIRVRD